MKQSTYILLSLVATALRQAGLFVESAKWKTYVVTVIRKMRKEEEIQGTSSSNWET